MSVVETARPGRLVTAVTGASGAIYAVRFVKACLELGLHVDLVVTDYGKRLLIEECGLNLKSEALEAWLDRSYGAARRPGRLTLLHEHDLDAEIASGSQPRRGMVVIPCSMKTLSGIAHGAASNLVERAADVTLKERRPLILVPRETPLNVIQLENMTRLARAGVSIVPAMPAFYTRPSTFEELADFIAGRVLSLLEVRHELYRPWRSEPT
jgi:4-hydroxy-3-polyprenylbenzoate decarboxylase